MGLDLAVSALLLANGAWFALGAVAFGLRSRSAARLVLPRRAGAAAPVEVVAGVVRFLGGLNAALAVLCVGVLVLSLRGVDPEVLALACLVVAVAHLSQVAVNLPPVLAERRGEEAVWPVRGRSMGVIFAVDGGLGVATAVLAVLLLADAAR